MAYESMCGEYPFGGSRPLHVEFCSSLPPLHPMRLRASDVPQAPSPVVWLMDLPSHHQACQDSLQAAVQILAKVPGLESSKNAIRVSGHRPGSFVCLEYFIKKFRQR